MRFSYLPAFLLLLLGGCQVQNSAAYRSINGFIQGTTYSIVYQDTTDRQPSIDSLLVDFDRTFSVFDSMSLICRLNRGDTDSVNGWFEECFAISERVYLLSDGLFDPTLGPLISAYGFGRKGEQREIDSVEFAAIMSTVGLSKIRIIQGKLVKDLEQIELDFNAVAQGYSTDLVSRMFDSLAVMNYMVEIGGEIFSRGVSSSGKAWKIGIDTPTQGNMLPGAWVNKVIELQGRGLATSGNYRKFIDKPSGERITHTIDPRNGLPATHNLLSATILAPTAAMADGLATACMVGGLEWSKKMIAAHPEVNGYLIYTDQAGSMQSCEL